MDRAVVDAPDRPVWGPLAIGVREKHNCCRRRDCREWPYGVQLEDAALDQELIVQRSAKVDGTAANDGRFSAHESADCHTGMGRERMPDLPSFRCDVVSEEAAVDLHVVFHHYVDRGAVASLVARPLRVHES